MKKYALIFAGAIFVVSVSNGKTSPVASPVNKDNVINLSTEVILDRADTTKVIYACPMHKEVVQDKPGKCPKCGMNLEKKVVAKDVYICPMHKEISQDKPGKCPKCGMALVKKEPAGTRYSKEEISEFIRVEISVQNTLIYFSPQALDTDKEYYLNLNLKFKMVEKLISFSLKNRYVVLVIAGILFIWGIIAVGKNPIDAIPDVSENQIIVFSEWSGRSPQVIEDQVTYPLISNLQGIPMVKNIRGTSMFGMSFIYIIFEDDADVYWARTRVLERLNSAQQQLPDGVTPTLGPDGTGVGHIFWYTLNGRGYDLGELRALQDWYVKFALQTVPGVSEVASFGGFQKQYQIIVDPNKLTYYNISLATVVKAARENNNDVSGRKLEKSDIGFIVRGLGYIKEPEDIEKISVGVYNRVPVLIRDIGTVRLGGDLRLGIFDENGEGEAVGGIIVMRYNENANKVIGAVKEKMKEVAKGLPEGVTFKTAYDRSTLIKDAVNSVKGTLIEEMIAVSLVVLFFLFHWRSALIILIQMPISIAVAFILLNAFNISSNIMSLTGIILAIGVIVDDTIVMVENSYRRLANESDNSRGTE